MTLKDVMAVILRYFTEFGKHAFQHITASICGGKFTFAISSPHEFLVTLVITLSNVDRFYVVILQLRKFAT